MTIVLWRNKAGPGCAMSDGVAREGLSNKVTFE